MVLKITYIILLFLIETFAQVLYYSIKIKFFTEFNTHSNLTDILFDTIYYFRSLKLVFYFPIYCIYFFSISKSTTQNLKKSLYHSSIFLLISTLLTLLLPWGVLTGFYDVVFLTSIAFVSSFIINYYELQWLK